MRTPVLALLLVACNGGGTSTGATGTPTGATCPAYVSLSQVTCASSTDAVATDVNASYFDEYQATHQATVVGQIGVTNLPAVRGLPACDGVTVPEANTIVLDDSAGERWVVGWNFEGTSDIPGILGGIGAGTELTLNVHWAPWAYGGMWGTSLLDADGPLLVMDAGGLTDAERGVEAKVNYDTGCVVDASLSGGSPQRVESYQVVVSTTTDSVELFSGETDTLTHPARELEVAVGDAYWLEGCADGCGYTGFAVWAQMP